MLNYQIFHIHALDYIVELFRNSVSRKTDNFNSIIYNNRLYNTVELLQLITVFFSNAVNVTNPKLISNVERTSQAVRFKSFVRFHSILEHHSKIPMN